MVIRSSHRRPLSVMITIYVPQRNVDSQKKNSEGALHVMNDNMKAIVIAMNEGEAREDVPHYGTIDREDARHLKKLELEHRRIAFTKETSHGYIKGLISIGDGLRSIS